ncbi:MAG: slipin family protein [Chloroflexi bacterium]|nr:slipin family protein [Chloroflexota bacterium]
MEWVALGVVGLIVVFAAMGIKTAQEYERGVIFRLGRLMPPRGPGLFIVIPLVERMVRVDLRVVTLEVQPQEIITRDNVTVKVNAVVYYRVIDPNHAVVQVLDYNYATSLISQTTLRSVLGQSEMDELLAQRDRLNARLQQIIDEQTEPWGIKVTAVEIKDVLLPDELQRAMARQAEAEREKRAKVIHAQGEYQAAEKLVQAAAVLASQENTIQLRYLQTLTELSSERNNTVVIPFPVQLIGEWLNSLRAKP